MCFAPDAPGGCYRTICRRGKQCTNTSEASQRTGLGNDVHDAIRPNVRESEGRRAMPTAAIIDSQSVKTTEKGGLVAMTLVRRYSDESDT